MRPVLGLILASAAASWAGQAAEVVVRSRPVPKGSLDPLAAVWSEVPAARVPLIPQKFVRPQGGGTTPWVEVRSVHTTAELFLKLSWEDPTPSRTLDTVGRFTDACAIQFPMEPARRPSPFMGEKGGRVNIWMWRAVAGQKERYPRAYADFHRSGSVEHAVRFPDRPVQSLQAEGFGTLAPAEVQDVEGRSEWAQGRWSVVLMRRLAAGEGATSFAGLGHLPVAFAIWDGGKGERDGIKSLSPWHTLAFGDAQVPEPKSELVQGARVFSRYGCSACHGPGGKGGVKNANSQGGEVPPLDRVALGFSEEELKAVIANGRASVPEDGRGPAPPLHMVAWKDIMGAQELDSLVHYLFSLLPKEARGEGF